MIKPIVTDPIFLARKSSEADISDISHAQDLLDTIQENKDRCVGMAGNMIGVAKRIIVFDDSGKYTVMFNPEIIKCSDKYTTVESCLSLTGQRNTDRWRTIKVKYQNEAFQMRIKTYSGWTAQIIQHEIDHLNGVLI
jgi:peptide deformylase